MLDWEEGAPDRHIQQILHFCLPPMPKPMIRPFALTRDNVNSCGGSSPIYHLARPSHSLPCRRVRLPAICTLCQSHLVFSGLHIASVVNYLLTPLVFEIRVSKIRLWHKSWLSEQFSPSSTPLPNIRSKRTKQKGDRASLSIMERERTLLLARFAP